MMKAVFYQSTVFWFLLLGALPFWLCLIYCFHVEVNFSWFYQHPWLYLYVGLLLPVIEEIVFRGFIQEQLARFLHDRHIGILSYANILTSLIFMSLHFLYHNPVWAVLVIIPSLVFGYCKDRYQNLGAPILLHVFYNTGYFMIFGAAGG